MKVSSAAAIAVVITLGAFCSALSTANEPESGNDGEVKSYGLKREKIVIRHDDPAYRKHLQQVDALARQKQAQAQAQAQAQSNAEQAVPEDEIQRGKRQSREIKASTVVAPQARTNDKPVFIFSDTTSHEPRPLVSDVNQGSDAREKTVEQLKQAALRKYSK